MAKKDRMCHSENDTRTGQGENLYYTTATDSLTSARNEFYEIGYYTQMDWNSTIEVVMAIAVSDSGKTYVVARYSPQGNFV